MDNTPEYFWPVYGATLALGLVGFGHMMVSEAKKINAPEDKPSNSKNHSQNTNQPKGPKL